MIHSTKMSKESVVVKVPRREFDAILGKLLSTPPKPVTVKRKARKKQ
jgi:hypothetical protein